ncbi:hypothetical protein CMK12_00830 [Candidatus Poribacteria bacterium]|nr:hypothetical protein [Candidatus Poribacteria bacterium]
MFASPKAGPAGRANWVVNVTLGIIRTFAGQTVEIWGMDAGGARTAERVPALLIGKDEENIGRHTI